MNKKKIAIVYKNISYYRKGIFKVLSNNINYHFEILSDNKEILGIKNIDINTENINFKEIKNIFIYKDKLIWQEGVISNILNQNYDCIIFVGEIGHIPVWIFSLLCKIFNIKVAFWTHGVYKTNDKGLRLFLYKILFKYLGDYIFCYGNYAKNNLIKLGITKDKIGVVYNSLNYDEQKIILKSLANIDKKEIRARIFTQEYLFYIIFLGRLVKEKKIDMILNVVSKLKQQNIEIGLIIIGNGYLKNSLLDMVEKLGIKNNCFFTGELYDETEIAKYFLISDMHVSPGNVGLNCIHAATYGVPTLTHNNYKNQSPEFEALELGNCGYYFEENNEESLLETLKQIIFSKQINNIGCKEIIEKYFNPFYQEKVFVEGIDKLLR